MIAIFKHSEDFWTLRLLAPNNLVQVNFGISAIELQSDPLLKHCVLWETFFSVICWIKVLVSILIKTVLTVYALWKGNAFDAY